MNFSLWVIVLIESCDEFDYGAGEEVGDRTDGDWKKKLRVVSRKTVAVIQLESEIWKEGKREGNSALAGSALKKKALNDWEESKKKRMRKLWKVKAGLKQE